jgi:superoxide dismutase, Cu-Zn family
MRPNVIALLLATAGLVPGFSQYALADPSPDRSSAPSSAPSSGAQMGFSSADFETYGPDAGAVTYNPKLVPVGAEATVLSTARPDGRTTVTLTVHGLLPNHAYGAHVHQKHCGPKGDDAGPHYQKVPDPVQPSVNPGYANPRNEIWLDFTTNKDGNASASSTVGWQFTGQRPGSVVLHAEHTRTDPGHAGMAGDRLACVNVDF